MGSKYINQGKKIMVKRGHVHPLWGAKKKEHPFDYDFQLLELSEPLKFDENVQAIKIAHIEDMIIGKVITVTGWGNTEENVSKSHYYIVSNAWDIDFDIVRVSGDVDEHKVM